MKTLFKILIIFILFPIAVSATEKKGKYTKNKVIKKEFSVNANATLNVVNKFGNIDIVTNNSNQIEIIVNISTNGDNEDKVIQRLNDITVDFEANTSLVSAKTIIEKNNSSWNLWGNKNNVNMEINYIIKMPISNNIKLTNNYGNINLGKIEGASTINCDYGSLNIGELLSDNNRIDINYLNKSNIDYIKKSTIIADYSTLHIEKSENIQLNADYTHISFGTVSVLNYDCDYGDLKIDTANNLIGNCDYMNTTIGKLNGSGTFEIDYGSLKINTLTKNFKLLAVNSSYTQIKLGLSESTAFNLNISVGYGNFKYGDNFNFSKEITKNTSKYYEGYYNSPTSNNSISIKANYGNVTFTNN
jgi:hypothetical protein